MLRYLLRFLRGYVRVRLEGGLPHRFFTRALQANLGLFNIRMRGNTARFSVPIGDYKALRKIARKSQCRMRMRSKHGLYFVLRKVRHRIPLTAGLAVFCLVLVLLGETVMTIRFGGSSTISKQMLEESLAANGLQFGMWQHDIEAEQVRQGLLLDNSRLDWATINLYYGAAVVEVGDAEDPRSDASLCIQLVAARDAQVKEIFISSGMVLVQENAIVQKGQVLAEAAPDMALPDSWTAGIEGAVYGYTEYSYTFELPRRHVFRDPTGASVSFRTLEIGGLSIPLTFRRNHFHYFDEAEYIRPVTLFSTELPARIRTWEYTEIEQRPVLLDENGALKILRQQQTVFEQEQFSDSEIRHCETTLALEDGVYRYTVRWLCYENIGEYIYWTPL